MNAREKVTMHYRSIRPLSMKNIPVELSYEAQAVCYALDEVMRRVAELEAKESRRRTEERGE